MIIFRKALQPHVYAVSRAFSTAYGNTAAGASPGPSRSQDYSRHEDIIRNYTPVDSYFDRIGLMLKTALLSYQYPQNGVYVSELGCLSSHYRLQQIYEKMVADPVGRQILEEKPRINSRTLNLYELIKLPENTVGHGYAKFMLNRGFKSDDRPITKYIADFELAYVYQRYKEVHDFFHVILGYDVKVMDEIVVKWFEMVQLGLPSAAMSALVAPLKLNSDMRKTMMDLHMPSMLQNAQNCKFVLNIYYEKHLNQDINEFRKEIGVRPCVYRTMI